MKWKIGGMTAIAILIPITMDMVAIPLKLLFILTIRGIIPAIQAAGGGGITLSIMAIPIVMGLDSDFMYTMDFSALDFMQAIPFSMILI